MRVAWSTEMQLELGSQACHRVHHLALSEATPLTQGLELQREVAVVIGEGGCFAQAWEALRGVRHPVC